MADYPCLTLVSAIILLCDNVYVCRTGVWNRSVQIHISVKAGLRAIGLLIGLDHTLPESLFLGLVASVLCGFLLHFTPHLLGPI